MDEAESTDSAESFMYESNPADSRRHIGRYGRGRGAGAHPSLLGSESPFPLAAREDDGADDERTPLLTSVRFRSRGVRRPYAVSVARPATRGWWARVAGWITLTVLAICLLSAVAGGLVGFSNPLRNVHVKDIRNVLASEPEIMLDLNVHAVNTNLLTIQVSPLNMVFITTPLTNADERCRSTTWTSTSSPRASTWRRPRGGGTTVACRHQTWWIERGVIQVFPPCTLYFHIC